MRSKKQEVAIVSCSSYNQKEVDKAVKKALDSIDFKFKKNKRVLIKPNLIGPFAVSKAATTHFSLVDAVCKILKKYNCKIIIAESSYANTLLSFKTSGVEKVAKKYNAKLVSLNREDLIKIKGKGSLRSFYLPKVFQKVDLIINMPKLKTHMLTKYTGAVKNLFGVISGERKMMLHKKFPDEEKFCRMLIDLYEIIKPDLNIMDGVYGMEGEGPTSGVKKKTGLILASTNAPALDIVACDIMGYKEKDVFTNVIAKKRKLVNEIKIIGKKKKVFYKKPKSTEVAEIFIFIATHFPSKIVVDKEKCTRCGTCERHCPVKAMHLKPYPVVDKKKCIRCFCCIEVCPTHALSLKDSLISKIANKITQLRLKVKR